MIVGYVFYAKARYRKQLRYSVTTNNLVFRTRDYPSDLRITYAGREINKVVRCTVYVWNSGNQPIRKADLKTKMPLKFSVADATTVLQSSISAQSRTANNVCLLGLAPQFGYLNIGDGFVADIFVEPRNDDRVTIELQGEVVGASSAPTKVDFHYGSDLRTPIFALVLSLSFAVAGGILFYRMTLASGNEPSTLYNVVDFAMSGALSAFGTILSISSVIVILSIKGIPGPLLLEGEEKDSWLIRLRKHWFGKDRKN